MAVIGFLPALVLVIPAILRPPSRMVVTGIRTVAAAGVGLGAFVVLDGVYAI